MRSIDNLSGQDFWVDTAIYIKQAIQKAKDQLGGGGGISHDHVMGKLRERYLNK